MATQVATPEDLTALEKSMQEWVKKYVDSILTPVVVPPVIVPPVVVPPVTIPDPVLNKCKLGPIITKITILTPTKISMKFKGEDVFFGKLVVLNPAGGIISPVDDKGVPVIRKLANDKPEVTVKETLVNATYCAQFIATSCMGSYSFKFNGLTGAEVTEEKPCVELGEITSVTVTNK